MSKSVYLGANVEVTSDSFGGWISKTNQIRNDMGTVVVTVASVAQPNNTNGAETSGNAHVEGIFSATTLSAVDGLRGGTVSLPANLYIITNTEITSAATTFAVTANTTLSGANVYITSANTTVGDAGTDKLNVNAVADFNANVNIDGIFTQTANAVFSGALVDITGANTTVGDAGTDKLNVNATSDFNANVNIDGILTQTANAIFSTIITVNQQANTASLMVRDLTATRVPFVSTDGEIVDSANFVFNSANSTFAVTGNTTVSANLSVTNVVSAANVAATHVGTSTLGTSGLATLNSANVVSSFRVSGLSTLVGNTSFSNNVIVTGDLTVLGNFSSENTVTSVSAGSGISVTGTNEVVVSHSDTSSVANLAIDNAGGTVLQDLSLTFDTYGHVTDISSASTNLDNRYPQVTFKTITVDDTDTEYTWSETGSAVADGLTDTLTFVSGTDINIDVDAALDAIRIQDTSTLSTVTGRGATTATAISITNTTDSTSTTTGALKVSGGVGIAKQLRVGGNTTISGLMSVSGNTTFSANVTIDGDLVVNGVTVGGSGGGATDLAYTSATTQGTVTSSTGTDAVIPAATSSIAGLVTTGTQTFSGTKTFSSNINAPGITRTGDYTIDASGDIILDADGGQIYLKDAGTQRGYFDIVTVSTIKLYAGTTLNTTWNADNMTVVGDVTSNSDARLKENVITVDSALEKVSQMRGVYFNKIGEENRSVGVIAQEMEEVLPEVVLTATDEEGIKSVAYGNIVGVLIEAIKELKGQIDELNLKLELKTSGENK